MNTKFINDSDKQTGKISIYSSLLIKKIKHLLVTTPIEVFIGASGIMVLGIVLGYFDQAAKAGKIPLVFSEIGQTKKNYAKEGLEVPPMTSYYGVANDISMKVFEANNIAFSHGYTNKNFAQELEYKMDITFKEHHQISEYSKEFPVISDKALSSLSVADQAAKDIALVNKAFEKTWKADHKDVFHTEIETVTVYNSKGVGHPEIRTKRVYDYTIHTYTYHPEYGQEAKSLLAAFLEKYPNIPLEDIAPKITSTGAENEYAIEKSIQKDSKYRIIDSAEAMNVVQKNYNDTTLEQNKPVIYSIHQKLKGYLPVWINSLLSAKSVQYRTSSSTDAGPKEYQDAENILDNGKELKNNIDQIVIPVKTSNELVQNLQKDIVQYIQLCLDRKGEGNKDEIRNEIMDLSKRLYKENFKNGVDVETFKVSVVLLYAFIGLLVGGFLGFLADRYIDIRYRRFKALRFRR